MSDAKNFQFSSQKGLIIHQITDVSQSQLMVFSSNKLVPILPTGEITLELLWINPVLKLSVLLVFIRWYFFTVSQISPTFLSSWFVPNSSDSGKLSKALALTLPTKACLIHRHLHLVSAGSVYAKNWDSKVKLLTSFHNKA